MDNRESWKNWEGRTVEGKFPLRQWLGGSYHSAVFLTERGEQKAAIKLVAANGLDADGQLSRWAATAKLSHPHLLQLFETGRCEFDGTPLLYVVMEYAEENLSQIIPERALTPAEAADCLPPVLDALAFLHSKGYVHGRVRPSNILAIDNHLKVSVDSVSPWGESDRQTGSPDTDVYDAPETATNEISPAIDVWSLGATLVVVLTQHLPAYRASEQKDPVVPGTIPEPFLSIARECLHRHVKLRCTIADIKAWRPPQAAPVPAPAKPAPYRPAPNRPAPIDEDAKDGSRSSRSRARIVIPAAVVTIAVFIVILLGHHSNPDKTSAAQPPAATKKTTPEAPAPAPPASQPPASPKAAPSSGAVVHQVIPDIPQSAKNTITGKIKIGVRVEVDASGKVTDAKLTHAGPSRYFANAALKAAQQWEFTAPQINGQPSPSKWNLTFQLSRGGIKAISAQERARH